MTPPSKTPRMARAARRPEKLFTNAVHSETRPKPTTSRGR
jgi:hypothetical protein